jgi:DNA-binding MarR family transcriptional regulator
MRDEVGPASGLVRLTFLVQALYAEVGRGCDLPVAQAQLLCVLTNEAMGMAELSGVLGVERSSLTGLVDRAEQRGLVERQADPSDRRAVRVALTKVGAKTVGRFHRELTDRLESLLEDLPAVERERFGHTLSTLVAEAPPVFTD